MLSRPHARVSFAEASCVVPLEIYAEEIARIARSVLDFAGADVKQFVDDFDRSEWLDWRVEIRENLEAFATRFG